MVYEISKLLQLFYLHFIKCPNFFRIGFLSKIQTDSYSKCSVSNNLFSLLGLYGVTQRQAHTDRDIHNTLITGTHLTQWTFCLPIPTSVEICLKRSVSLKREKLDSFFQTYGELRSFIKVHCIRKLFWTLENNLVKSTNTNLKQEMSLLTYKLTKLFQ